ncbi:protein kinase [bacterium]|nr:protein kinase [bacterium]
MSGSRLGSYEIISVIGSGGMGEMYCAKDPEIGREVAIKILPCIFTQNPDRLRRFELEARTAGSLNHPNIIIVHTLGNHEGSPYLVSELLEGETLRNVYATELRKKKQLNSHGRLQQVWLRLTIRELIIATSNRKIFLSRRMDALRFSISVWLNSLRFNMKVHSRVYRRACSRPSQVSYVVQWVTCRPNKYVE